MKTKILLSVLIIGMITGAFAQTPTLTLTFTADNNGQIVPLNSILIENLTQGGDTTLYAPDTVLILDYMTGVSENDAIGDDGFTVFQNFPNPMEEKTEIRLYLPEKDLLLITINDIIGRELINKEYQLERGNHSFTFYPGNENLYFFSARIYSQIQTIKMFNYSSKVNGAGNFKLEYKGNQVDFTNYKSGTDLNSFTFNLGDQLKFTSFTFQGERVITSSPSGDQTYCFQYTGNPCPGTPTVADIDGNVYNTVLIGEQCWMKENLKTTTYKNGTSIPNVTEGSSWTNLTTGAYVWYGNEINWKEKYGALYNWFATIDPNGLCPVGWHVPSHTEWTTLTTVIGGTSSPFGNKLKSCRQVNLTLGGYCNTSEHPRWEQDITHYGTDDYGFSTLPGGYCNNEGSFGNYGNYGHWWSSTNHSSTNSWGRTLGNGYGYVAEGNYSKLYGLSVRCLRD